MFKIGCHLSSSKGFLAMGKEAISINANTFQFFTRNPRGGSAKPLDLDDIKNYISFAKENGIQTIVAHAPYTLNACSKDASIRKFALDVFKDDIERLEHIPGSLYNFHPGSHVEQGVEIGIKYIVELLDKVIKEKMQTTILLETMAGKGSEIGRNFDELKEIISKVKINKSLGVCLDTCHVYDAGYDIVNNLEDVLGEFDKKIGIKRLKAIHINDSMNPFASHKDRHQKIGQGSIPINAFSRIINHPLLKDLPFILETPNDINGYKEEIALLRSLYK